MNQDSSLQAQYAANTDMELLLIAKNINADYTDEAVQAATAVLLSRYKNSMNLEQIWNKELDHLVECAQKCSICQNPEVIYTKEFLVLTLGSPDSIRSTIGMASALFGSGIGFISESHDAVKLELKLCERCLASRMGKSWTGKQKVRISRQDYASHPLLAFYGPLGYTDIRVNWTDAL